MNSLKLYLYSLIARLIPESRGYGIKNALLRWAGAKIGANVRIFSSVQIVGTGSLVIGNDVHIGSRALIYAVAPAGVTIGDCVDIAPEVILHSGSHKIDSAGVHIAGEGNAVPIVIGSGSWLGARATILPGVTLPEKTLVAAGAVVTKSIDAPSTLLAGVPAVAKKVL